MIHAGLMLHFLETEMSSNRNFEFLNAVLRVVLEVHADMIAAHPQPLQEQAARLRKVVQGAWARLGGLLGEISCMLSYFSNLHG